MLSQNHRNQTFQADPTTYLLLLIEDPGAACPPVSETFGKSDEW
jgi:hypothetical protein